MSADLGKPTTGHIEAMRALLGATRNVSLIDMIDVERLRAEMRRRAPEIMEINRFLGLSR